MYWLSSSGGLAENLKSIRQKLQARLSLKLKLTMSVPFFQTETEVQYQRPGPMTDYVCKILELIVAVSVTRGFSHTGSFAVQRAILLLRKKLRGKSAKLLCFITD